KGHRGVQSLQEVPSLGGGGITLRPLRRGRRGVVGGIPGSILSKRPVEDAPNNGGACSARRRAMRRDGAGRWRRWSADVAAAGGGRWTQSERYVSTGNRRGVLTGRPDATFPCVSETPYRVPAPKLPDPYLAVWKDYRRRRALMWAMLIAWPFV